ncbi:STAG-domain-containing protein, partial [Meira miltonrushii]
DDDQEDDISDTYQPTKKRKTDTGAKATKSKSKPTEKNKTAQPKKKQASTAIGSSRTRKGGSKEDLAINTDNVLFNAILESDLRSTAQEWMALYVQDEPKAMSQFLTFVIRACGSNETIDEVQATDADSADERLEEIQSTFKKQSNPSYPLISKAPAYRKFRRSTSQLMEHIFTAASEADVLDDETLIDTIVAWLGAMTSSKYRAIRHTSTAIVLMMIGQIARLNKEAREKFEQLSKQKDAEGVKKNPARHKAFMDQINSVNKKRKKLDTYHQELDEAVFIHRYRDSDPTIRADCMEELGRWMLMCPEQFLKHNYLNYYWWEMSDENASVRMVVVQGLRAIYLRHPSSNALDLFTEKSLTRMIEIATGDVDLNVRIAMINTLLHVDQSMDLDDDEARETLARHIFDTEAKVRAVVARFFAHIVEERITDASDENRMRFKQMASFLVQLLGEEDDENDVAPGVTKVSRALESILAVPDCQYEWKSLIELLQLDHSAATGRKRGGNSANAAEEEYRLEAREEDVLLECMEGADDEQEEEQHAAMTQQLMTALPKLFGKYKTESERVTKLLALLPHMNLASYLEYQQMAAYETLWDTVIDQFERHTETHVVNSAAEAIASMANTKALNAVNDEKLLLLRQSVISALQEAVPSFEQLLGNGNLQHDEIHRLSACTNRLKLLFRHVDLSQDIDESGEENANGGIWDILLACTQRISLEKEGEGELIENAIVILGVYIIWKTNAIVNMDEGPERAAQAEALLTKRQAFLSSCERVLEVQTYDDNLAAQRQAFRHMLDVYIIYANLAAIDEERKRANAEIALNLPQSLQLSCTASAQDHLANFVTKECERCAPREEEEDEFASLQREEELSFIVSHYVGAIRLGIVDIRKSADILARYGQMGELYDACLRILIEAIREVGIQDQKPRTACAILSDTLTKAQTFNNADEESNFINLAKLLSSCLVVRGPHLTILQSIDSKEVIKMHDDLVYQTLKIEGRWTTLKALAQLVISLKPNEALKIQVSLNKILEQIDQNSASESDQDALRTYEKRLVTLASK